MVENSIIEYNLDLYTIGPWLQHLEFNMENRIVGQNLEEVLF